MNEPANHTAWVDRYGDTWVRVDECRGLRGHWWPMTDGPGWEKRERGGMGGSFPWREVDREYGSLHAADPTRTARALARVRQEWAR